MLLEVDISNNAEYFVTSKLPRVNNRCEINLLESKIYGNKGSYDHVCPCHWPINRVVINFFLTGWVTFEDLAILSKSEARSRACVSDIETPTEKCT